MIVVIKTKKEATIRVLLKLIEEVEQNELGHLQQWILDNRRK